MQFIPKTWMRIRRCLVKPGAATTTARNWAGTASNLAFISGSGVKPVIKHVRIGLLLLAEPGMSQQLAFRHGKSSARPDFWPSAGPRLELDMKNVYTAKS